jgi:CHAT domain-containing protein/tetratricopeptide (TPR) repeat protein
MPLFRQWYPCASQLRWPRETFAIILVAATSVALPAWADSGDDLSTASSIAGAVESQGFIAPPRTIADITAILDQQKPDPAVVAAEKLTADAIPDASLQGIPLAKFLMRRGAAAGDLGREAQRLADYRQAYSLVEPHKDKAMFDYGMDASLLAVVELRAGNRQRALQLHQKKIAFFESLAQGDSQSKKNSHQGQLFNEYFNLVAAYVELGRFQEAKTVLDKADALLEKSRTWTIGTSWAASWQYHVDWAHGLFVRASGKYTEAEVYLRKALAENIVAVATARASGVADESTLDAMEYGQDVILQYLAGDLLRQNRLLEAESAARLSLLHTLRKRGRYASETAGVLAVLGAILLEEGRPADAEALARAAIDIYQHLGHEPDSYSLDTARADLAGILVVRQRYSESMSEFDAIRQGMAKDPDAVTTLVDANLAYVLAAIRTGQKQEALRAAKLIYERRNRTLGDKHLSTAEAEGFYAVALAANGDRPAAEAAFQAAVPILLSASHGAEDDQNSLQGRHRRLRFILESYLRLLWNDRAAIGRDKAADEAFLIADAVRGQAVQQALVAAAARAAVRDPQLSDLARREQDAERQIAALNAVLADALSAPTDQQDAKSIQDMQRQVDKLRGARATIREEIERRFPDYVNLIDPRPITASEAQALLKPGQALIVTYVADDRTYVWALRNRGPLAFASVLLSANDIDRRVATLRHSLDPQADTLADIPSFDVQVANQLYDSLLKPVEAGWKGSPDLLVVAHGSLAELPFALLVTAPVSQPVDTAGKLPFSGYVTVPWLIRQASVTSLPSVSSLKALATLAAAPSAARPFIGFGDAWFSKAEAAEGEAETGNLQLASAAASAGMTTRGVRVRLRSVPPSTTSANADLSILPRLPETADELRVAAKALNADPIADVYLGKRASEATVRRLKLDDRRIVMFATHGLVPGDLLGLAEPALALTAPSVAGTAGDGLLTTTKILGLRLNADWVVLSACNTAAGNGAGAEAVTGLGLAFIYAGARAILVTNWPVETNSARALTAATFRDLVGQPGVTRAAALRQAMLTLIDGSGYLDASGHPLFSYAHPIFWAPFSLIGDGGASH